MRLLGSNLPVGGGGYLWLLPVGVVGRGLRAAARRGCSGMLYVHPWELDAEQPVGPGDRLIAERLAEAGSPVVVAVNKTDRASHQDILRQLTRAGEWDFHAFVPISALKGDGLDALRGELEPLMPEGPFFFPPDMHSDQPDRLLAAELVREKYLARLRDELPHSLAVVVDDIEERDNGALFIPASSGSRRREWSSGKAAS